MRGRPRKNKSIPKKALKIAKDRRHERRITIKAVSSITAEQFARRHEYCISILEIQRQMDRDSNIADIISADLKKPRHERRYQAVCDHPEDGMCGQTISSENLQKVNDKLAFRVSPPKQEEASEVEDGIQDYESFGTDSVPDNDHSTTKRFNIKIGGKSFGT